jgi:hypothetical protein
MMTDPQPAPEKIWLELDDDGNVILSRVFTCGDGSGAVQPPSDVEYVRADLLPTVATEWRKGLPADGVYWWRSEQQASGGICHIAGETVFMTTNTMPNEMPEDMEFLGPITVPTPAPAADYKCAGLPDCKVLEGSIMEFFVHDKRCPASNRSAGLHDIVAPAADTQASDAAEFADLRERYEFYKEYERPVVAKDYKRLLDLCGKLMGSQL